MRNVIRVLVPVLAFVGLVLALVVSQRQQEPLHVSGFVEADQIRVGSRVGGRVARVLVQEGQMIQAGELLLELEPFDLLAQQAKAEADRTAAERDYQRLQAGLRPQEVAMQRADLEQLQARLRELQNGPRPEEVATVEARLRQAEAQLALAMHDHERAQEMSNSQLLSNAQLDQATRALRDAEGARDVRVAELALLRAGNRKEVIDAAKAAVQSAEASLQLAQLGYRVEEVEQAKARLAAAAAEVARVMVLLAELRVVAPTDGIVEAIDLQPGDLVPANTPMLAMLDAHSLWVRAYLPEKELRFLPGHQVEVTVDAFPDRVFPGVLAFLSRQAEFTPGNVQTPEERSKQVFRIKVTLADAGGALRPGMAADVWLEPRDRR